jgi:xylulokinase
MSPQHILTIDVGTSSTKTSLWTEVGQMVAHATSAYELQRAEPLWAEIDAEVWWQAVCRTIRSVLAASEVDPLSVAGIGVDAVGWTLIPVDHAGNPLHPAMIWLDRRAEKETNWLKSLPKA